MTKHTFLKKYFKHARNNIHILRNKFAFSVAIKHELLYAIENVSKKLRKVSPNKAYIMTDFQKLWSVQLYA